MRFLLNRWRGIGTRLYLALGFAVLLTLVSSGVGVYYFERSGDVNHRAESESVPVLEASWEVSRGAERLRALGLELLAGTGEVREEDVSDSITSLENALVLPNGVPVLAEDAANVQASAYVVADSIDALRMNRAAAREADGSVAELQERMAGIPGDSETSVAGLRLLERVFQADDGAALDGMWDEFIALSLGGLGAPVRELGEGQGAFAVRRLQLALVAQRQDLSASFEAASGVLEDSTAAGRLTRSVRRLTLHLPQRWPWEAQFTRALTRLRAIHLPA